MPYLIKGKVNGELHSYFAQKGDEVTEIISRMHRSNFTDIEVIDAASLPHLNVSSSTLEHIEQKLSRLIELIEGIAGSTDDKS